MRATLLSCQAENNSAHGRAKCCLKRSITAKVHTDATSLSLIGRD